MPQSRRRFGSSPATPTGTALRHVRGRGANGPRKEATGCRPETSCDLNDDMVRLLGGVGDGGEDVVPLETGIVRQDFLD